MRYIIFLALILCGTATQATSGLSPKEQTYTVDAIEINWKWGWTDGWGPNGQPIKVAKISFCQVIYWEWIGKEWNKKVPRPGWKALGYTMYDVKEEKGEKVREVEFFQRKVTYPRKNHGDGFWYITVKDGFTRIQVRTKVLIGDINGTNTLYDPESKDLDTRKSKRCSPMDAHKEIMKSRQDAMMARLERHSQAEDQ